ncbi:MAG: SDR family oxidoreductase [Desulfovibrionaceae bacterium]|nr:SDR family oxidoreductase [Desulfovibrionaceae bacterium]
MYLEGKTAIITGAGRGFGRAVAQAMAGKGAQVVLFSRSEPDLDKVRGKIEASGGQVLVATGDVSAPDDVRRAVHRAIERFGGVDVLVNNAAVIGPARLIEDCDLAAWERTLAVNLTGAFVFCREVLPDMAAHRTGVIVNVTSGLGSRGYPRLAAYSASKAGLNQLTRSLAEEFREYGVLAYGLDPGVMDTGMQADIRRLGRDRLGDEIYGRYHRLSSAGGLRQPSEVAKLACVLAAGVAPELSGSLVSMSEYQDLRLRISA